MRLSNDAIELVARGGRRFADRDRRKGRRVTRSLHRWRRSALRRCKKLKELGESPYGRWVVAAPTALVFCAHAELGGAVAWGRPTREDSGRMLAAYDALRHLGVAARFDVMLDGRAVSGVDPSSLSHLLEWLANRREELARRIRVQVGVIADSLTGVTLAGILPILGETHSFRVMRDRRSALRAVGASAVRRDRSRRRAGAW